MLGRIGQERRQRHRGARRMTPLTERP
jgi:hypothetical protein